MSQMENTCLDEKFEVKHENVQEATQPPPRTSIRRKAKEKCIERTKKTNNHSDSESCEEVVKRPFAIEGSKSDDSDKDYDSDKDPVWMPFELDLKQGHDFDEKRRKQKRPRLRLLSSKSAVKTSPIKPSSKSAVKTSPIMPSSKSAVKTSPIKPSSTQSYTPSQPVANVNVINMEGTSIVSDTPVQSMYKLAEYVIEKKDIHNYEGYPIWRVETGNIIRKFEAIVQGGTLKHQSTGKFSAWMKSRENQFELVKVKELPVRFKTDPALVEVLEECRPKPPTDEKLELQYEDDPLVEMFTIYLQVFLSQALESNFLKAIIETDETFYVDALNKIDQVIDSKCQVISTLAQWKSSFQECLHKSPLMKEIDRPNLRQTCQASENSSPPTIKSVLLSGQPYNRFLLNHIAEDTDQPQEFMIGKVTALYVHPYHSLYHFKYWLKQRCDTKVKMMKDGGKGDSNENILDKCLEEKNWVLQLFDNLKKLLKFGEDVPS